MIDPQTSFELGLPPQTMDSIVFESCGKPVNRTKT